MFEWHGCATIRGTADSFDSQESVDLDEAASAAVLEFMAALSKVPDFETWDIQQPNGQTHLWPAGFRNHRQDRVLAAYRDLAGLAPGSYGVLYVLDDELKGDASNEWQRWVMIRGRVALERDNSLSPHLGRVEDSS